MTSYQSSQQQQQQHTTIDLAINSSENVLQNHLKQCFLKGICWDVKVRVERWSRVYKLHKVVLVQSAFFNSLFLGGFSEDRNQTSASSSSRPSTPVLSGPSTTSADGRQINLHLDDPNISRAAFELLLARLYSTGPHLHLDPATHPSPLHPLTPSFPSSPPLTSTATVHSRSNTTTETLSIESHQPATPRFLLSILATSIYLGLPGITASVLALVVGTTSPFSVCTYLNFAIGKGIGGYGGEDWEDGHRGEHGTGAVGLEDLGELVEMISDQEDVDVEEGEEVWYRGQKVDKAAGRDLLEGIETRIEGIKLGPSGSISDDSTPMQTSVPSRSNSQRSKPGSSRHSPAPSCAAPLSRSSSRRHGKDLRHPLDRSPDRSDKRRGRRESQTSISSMRSSLIGAIRDPTLESPRTSAASSDQGEEDADRGDEGDEDGEGNESTEDDAEELEYFYGATSDRIGEACACWLARWGVDVLGVEEALVRTQREVSLAAEMERQERDSARSKGKGRTRTGMVTSVPSSSASIPSPRPAHRYRPIQRAASPHRNLARHRPSSPPLASSSFLPSMPTPPPIWSLNGLPSSWVRTIISSDAFFLPGSSSSSLDGVGLGGDGGGGEHGEMERYRVARRVWDLRLGDRAKEKVARREAAGVGECSDGGSSIGEDGDDWEWEEEEEEFEELFKSGIYYTHLSFDQLSFISSDINPLTSLPFAPLQTLQVCLWQTSELKSKILASTSIASIPSSSASLLALSSPPPSSPAPSTDGASPLSPELGITTSTERILAQIMRAEEKAERALLRNALSPGARKRSRSRSGSQSSNLRGGSGSPYSPQLSTAASSSWVSGSPFGRPTLAPLGGQGRLPSSGASSYSGSGRRSLPVGGGGGGGGLLSGDSSTPMERTFWPVATDDTSRWGEYGGFIPLPSTSSSSTRPNDPSLVNPAPINPIPQADTQTPAATGNAASGLGGKKASSSTGERDFFGLGPTRRKGRGIVEDLREAREMGRAGEEERLMKGVWTRFEPFRFSVEFWGVDQLKEKQRLYSTTVGYAGSLFNVYVQTIKKKDRQVQLGVYLHRQSMLSPIPTPSAPPLPPQPTPPFASTTTTFSSRNPASSSNSMFTFQGHPPMSTSPSFSPPNSLPTSPGNLSSSLPLGGGVGPSSLGSMNNSPSASSPLQSRSFTGQPSLQPSPIGVVGGAGGGAGGGGIAGSSNLGPAIVVPQTLKAPVQEFKDPRQVLKCYFSISCPSALGTALTRFSSLPDVFAVSQSWGWKSSSLRSDEYLATLPSVDEAATQEDLPEGTLGWTGTMSEAEYGRLQSLRATVVVGLV